MNHRLVPLEQAFPRRKRPLLMTGVVVGDPIPEATGDYIDAICRGGADILELIVPFSDATYYGQVLRRACKRAMSEAITWDDVEELIADFRGDDEDTPVVVSSYFNRVLARDPVRCLRGLAQAGADAILIVDLPAEEAEGIKREAEEHELALIQTVAATTTQRRFRRLAAGARGFLMWTGRYGAEVEMEVDAFRSQIEDFRQYTELPIVASMNVETGSDAAEVAQVAHGVSVSSSLAWLIEGKGPNVEERLEAFVADLRTNLDG